jgi:hypothetical protein
VEDVQFFLNFPVEYIVSLLADGRRQTLADSDGTERASSKWGRKADKALELLNAKRQLKGRCLAQFSTDERRRRSALPGSL